MAITQQQVLEYLQSTGQSELAALVRQGGTLAGQICQNVNRYLNGNGGAALVPVMSPTATPTPIPGGPSFPVPNGGGCSTGQCGFPPPPPSGGCGAGCGGSGGSCGCGGGKPGNGNCTVGAPLCGTSGPYGCGAPVPIPVPAGGCPIPPGTVPACGQVGDWNCRAVDGDLAPCDIEQIEREDKLLTFEGTLAGPLSDGDDIALLVVPIGIAHELCIEELDVSVTAEGATTAMTIGEVSIQAERIYQDGDGSYVHGWTYEDPERPSYLEVTSSRCRCANLCACVTPEGRVRIVFRLTSAVAMGATLNVTIWGRRCNWLLQNGCKQSMHNANGCGPCPPCAVCNHTELTNTELGYTEDTLYSIP